MIGDRTIILPRHQQYAKKIFDKIDLNKRQIILIGSVSGTGKCLGIGTKILMHDGSFKNVEDIKINDKIMTPDSKFATVTSTIKNKGKLFKIKQLTGQDYICNEHHILSLRLYDSRKKTESYHNISVKEFLNLPKTKQEKFKGYKVSLSFNYKSVDIEPYFLGIWLGDGRSDSQVICCPSKEIHKYLKDYSKILDLKFVEYKDKRNCNSNSYSLSKTCNQKSNILYNMLNKNNLLNNKHIPNNYKYNIREIRLQILAGLLDTDGYLYNGNFDIIIKSEKLADDVCFLARSLGFRVNKRIKNVKFNFKNGDTDRNYFHLSIIGDCSIIPTKVKKAPKRKINKNHLVTGIKIEPLGIGEYYGFTLNNNEKLFLLEDLTVTHNTESADVLQELLYNKNKESLVLSLDDFYNTLPTIRTYNRKKLGIDSVGLSEIDWEDLKRICHDFQEKKPIHFKRVHKYANLVEHNALETEDLNYLIIEGLYANYLKKENYGDLSVFIEGTPKQTLSFRKKRRKEDESNSFRKKVVEKEFRVICQLKRYSNLIIPFEHEKSN